MTPSDENKIRYALAKQIPCLSDGFSIETNYGVIEIEAGDAEHVAAVIEELFKSKLEEQ